MKCAACKGRETGGPACAVCSGTGEMMIDMPVPRAQQHQGVSFEHFECLALVEDAGGLFRRRGRNRHRKKGDRTIPKGQRR